MKSFWSVKNTKVCITLSNLLEFYEIFTNPIVNRFDNRKVWSSDKTKNFVFNGADSDDSDATLHLGSNCMQPSLC